MTPKRRKPGPVRADTPRPAPAAAPAQGRNEDGRFGSKYRPEFCEQVIEHMGEGASATSFAANIGVSPSTLRDWAEAHPEFAEAKDKAFAKAQAWWEGEIRRGLFDEVISEGQGKERVTTTRRLNSNAARLVMMNLFGWSERQAQDVTERRVGIEDAGYAPYSEWAAEDLRTLNMLLHKYRREPVPVTPTVERDPPTPRKRPVPEDDDVALN